MSDLQPKLGDRSWFPDLQPRAYLNHAAISPPSLPLRQLATELLDDYARRGVGAHLDWAEGRERLRTQLAQLIHARSGESIAFVPNTSRGVTDVALCFPWQPGDRVVLIEGEFPANVTPWQRAAEQHQLQLTFLPRLAPHGDQGVWLERLEQVLADADAGPPRLLAVSAVQFQTGLRMPLEAIARRCHARGTQLFVDAIQACGVVPLDVVAMGIDYLSCGSHKWLMGFEGCGFVYVAPERVAALRPHVASWLSHDEPFGFLFEGGGKLRYDRPIVKQTRFVEGGMPNTLGCAALERSLQILLTLGPERIFTHVQRYLDALEPKLQELGLQSQRSSDVAARSGILSFLPPAGIDVIALYNAIDGERVSCSTPDGHLRFAPHWPNHNDEIGDVVACVGDALQTLR